MFEALAVTVLFCAALIAAAIALHYAIRPRLKRPYALTIADAHASIRAAQRFPSR